MERPYRLPANSRLQKYKMQPLLDMSSMFENLFTENKLHLFQFQKSQKIKIRNILTTIFHYIFKYTAGYSVYECNLYILYICSWALWLIALINIYIYLSKYHICMNKLLFSILGNFFVAPSLKKAKQIVNKIVKCYRAEKRLED